MKRLFKTLFILTPILVIAIALSKKPIDQNPKTNKLKLQDGFAAEHIYSPSENKMGSWVSMCFDDKGRMLTSDQYGGIFRLEIPSIGSKDLTPKVEKIQIEGDTVLFGAAHGLLYAFNSLYVLVNNMSIKGMPKRSGFYRMQDTDGNDKFDKLTLLKPLKGDGEHGPHSIKLSPDKKSLYLICGNYTDLPEVDTYKLPKTWKYDNLFTEIKDPRGHANDRKEPGGWVVNVQPDGSKWELVSAGYRNPFDMAFNDIGDLFVYDADMEWDFGLPWYRPTRICHATSGSEFGWRTGDGKWNSYFPDNLPPVINIGQGSPTNLLYMKDAKFPAKYRNSLLAFDWSFGIMHSLHLKPQGASYAAEREEFLSGIPLPLTDGAIGPDGALYFLTGGRRLESDLYRVYYKGSESTEFTKTTEITPENKLRRQIEAFHQPNTDALKTIWDNLNHADRHIRYASRIALEHQNIAQWRDLALAEKNPIKTINSLISLTRSGTNTDKGNILKKLLEIDFNSLSSTEQMDLLRAYELVFSRFGTPESAQMKQLTTFLNSKYPAKLAEHNRQYCKLLVFLNSPEVIEKTLTLIENNKDFEPIEKMATKSEELILRNPAYGLDIAKTLEKAPPPQQIYLAMMLSKATTGWNDKNLDQYFGWYKKAFSYKGGNSYVGFLDRARKIALNNLPKDKKVYYDKLSGGDFLSANGNEMVLEDMPKGPGKRYNLAEMGHLFEEDFKGRNFKKGKAYFAATTCNRCHAVRGEGGNIGPELTQIGTRFSTKDMLEAILDPSKSVSDQYASTEFQMKNGQSFVGKITNQDANFYFIAQNPYDPDNITKIAKKNVISKQYSAVSSMLGGLINSLSEEELKDLLAYLKSGGDENAKYFK